MTRSPKNVTQIIRLSLETKIVANYKIQSNNVVDPHSTNKKR